MDETSLKERESREDLSCIIDSHGDTVELWLGEQINLSAAGAGQRWRPEWAWRFRRRLLSSSMDGSVKAPLHA